MLGSNARGHTRIGWRRWLEACLLLSIILIWIPRPAYAAIGNLALTHWRTLLTGFAIVGLTAVVGSTVVARHHPARESSSEDEQPKPLLREIPGWAIWAGIAGLVAVGLLATWWLVSSYGTGDLKTIEQNRIKLEAIKLAGSVVVGTGGVAALLLAARRQRVSELDLLQRDRIADTNRHDADERRATELYTAAAEQLASDKAPVRMAGMYALSRLGETNENLRQTIINLLCAYLRMPDISVAKCASPSNTAPSQPGDDDEPQHLDAPSRIVLDLAAAPLAALSSLAPDLPAQQQQERQVRITAQRLLAHHLRPDRRDDGTPRNPSYWPNIEIDLADADLHEWDFAECEVRVAEFSGARLHAGSCFSRAHFHDYTAFRNAHFYGHAFFDNTVFHNDAAFGGARFDVGGALFTGSKFHNEASFNRAHFDGFIWFDEVHVHGEARFSRAQFHDNARFEKSQFHETVFFVGARFHANVQFRGSSFNKEPIFDGALTRVTQSESKESGQREGPTWPTGWTVLEANREDGQTERWARVVPEMTPDCHQPGRTTEN